MTPALQSSPAPSDRAPSAVQRRTGRFGISIKLQVAFGVVAWLTVIAAAVALFSFETVERRLEVVNDRQMPVTIDAMRLSVNRPRQRGSSAPEPSPTSGLCWPRSKKSAPTWRLFWPASRAPTVTVRI